MRMTPCPRGMELPPLRRVSRTLGLGRTNAVRSQKEDVRLRSCIQGASCTYPPLANLAYISHQLQVRLSLHFDKRHLEWLIPGVGFLTSSALRRSSYILR